MDEALNHPPAAEPRLRIRHDHGRAKVMADAPHRWSEAAEARFLEALACSANVRRSAAEAGFTTAAIYRRRQAHAGFRARWAAALDQGYARIEAAVVRAAADTMEGVAFSAERPIPPMTVGEVLNLMKLHAASVGRNGHRYGPKARRRTMDEVREGIIRKVEAVRRRHGLPEANAE